MFFVVKKLDLQSLLVGIKNPARWRDLYCIKEWLIKQVQPF
jgi:hypothetical protein